MAKQFNDVSGRYGAPMGRRESHHLPNNPRSVRLFRVRLDSGGYDDGGAYWGLETRGERLYCARSVDDNDPYCEFVRARSRERAADILEIPDNLLTRGRTAAGVQLARLECPDLVDGRVRLENRP